MRGHVVEAWVGHVASVGLVSSEGQDIGKITELHAAKGVDLARVDALVLIL